MGKFNRAQRRTIEKRAFRANLQIDNIQKEAADQRAEDVAHRVVQICMRAVCLTELFHWKELSKKETRIKNTVDIMHGYINKIKENALSNDEWLAIKEVDESFTEWLRTNKVKEDG